MPITADASSLAVVASRDDLPGRPGRRRKDERLAAVLAEFGFRTRIVLGGDAPDPVALEGASLVVADVVRPQVDLPVEIPMAAGRGLDVLVLVPAGVPLAGLAGGLLVDCGATVVRYDRVEPHRALHALLTAPDAERAAVAADRPRGRFVRPDPAVLRFAA